MRRMWGRSCISRSSGPGRAGRRSPSHGASQESSTSPRMGNPTALAEAKGAVAPAGDGWQLGTVGGRKSVTAMQSTQDQVYERWRNAPEQFWAEAAEAVHWYRRWNHVLDA